MNIEPRRSPTFLRPSRRRCAICGVSLVIGLAGATFCLSSVSGTQARASAEPKTSVASASPLETARAVQQRLVLLRYLPADAVNGRWDYQTAQAVLAFQGWQGLTRDGVVGPQTRAALTQASAPVPRPAAGRIIEVFRAKGVTLIVDRSRLVIAIHSSSGRPGFETPAGVYRVFRKERNSWSVPYHVWLPYASYFNGGIAFHGSSDVPASPASHGCIRIPTPQAAFVYAFATVDTLVAVY